MELRKWKRLEMLHKQSKIRTIVTLVTLIRSYTKMERICVLLYRRTTDPKAHVSASRFYQLVKLTLVKQEEQHEYER